MAAQLEVLLSAKDISAQGFNAFKRSISTVTGAVFSLQGALAVLGGGIGLGSVVSAASDLNEVVGKFGVVFKDQISQAQRWADELRSGYALSGRAAKQNLAAVQDLLVPMGVAADKAGELSFNVVKLAADLGSFNNLPTAKVMEDIQSALVGNYETMKKYGVVLNETVVQQKALELGYAATKKELTAADKAQAAYKLIVESSSAAVGDMDRTSESYANQLKKVKAEFEDLQAELGKKILPTLADVLGDISATMQGEEFQHSVQNFALMLGNAAKSGVELFNTLNKVPKPVWEALGGALIGGRLGGSLGAAIGASTPLASSRLSLMKSIQEDGLPLNQIDAKIARVQARIEQNREDISGWRGRLAGTSIYEKQLADAVKELERLNQKRDSILSETRLSGSQVPADIYGVTTAGSYRPAIDSEADNSAFKKPVPDAIEEIKQLEGIDRELKRFFGGIDQATEGVRDDLTDFFDDIDARQKEIGIDQALDGYFGDLDEAEKRTRETYDKMIQLSQRTADAMEQNFSDYFYDAFTGQMKDIGDYWQGLMNSMKRAFADFLGQMVKESLFGGDGSSGFLGLVIKGAGALFNGDGGGGAAASGSAGYYESAADFSFDSGGYLGEAVRGVGVQSGRSYQLHADEFVLPRAMMSGGHTGGDTIAPVINYNISAVDARGVEDFFRRNAAQMTDQVLERMETSRSQRNRMRELN